MYSCINNMIKKNKLFVHPTISIFVSYFNVSHFVFLYKSHFHACE